MKPLVMRKVIYRMYPSKGQEAKLFEMLRLFQQLYNVALEQRITAWQTQRKSVSFVQQCRDLTELRAAFPEYGALNCAASQVTLKRLDRAFTAFFERLTTQQHVGFPRFKSLNRFPGWGYTRHGVGFRFTPGDGYQHGSLHLSGIGNVQLRGRARTPGEIRNCDIQRKGDRWYAVFTFACRPQRAHGDQETILTLGGDTFAALKREDGSIAKMAKPQSLDGATACIDQLTKELARKKAYSRNQLKMQRRLDAARRKIADRHSDFLHKLSARVIAESDLVGLVTPARDMFHQAGFDHSLTPATLGTFLTMLHCKAEEASVVIVKLPSPSEAVPCVSVTIPGREPLKRQRFPGRRREALTCVSPHSGAVHDKSRFYVSSQITHAGRKD
jgi:putative transposase